MRPPRHRRRKRPDRGAVTVEAAVALSAFTVLLGLALCGVGAAVDHVRCVDAAREAARLAARGEDELAKQAAAHIAPSGATVVIDVDGEHIEVDVEAAPVGGLLPGVRVRAEAFAVREPGG